MKPSEKIKRETILTAKNSTWDAHVAAWMDAVEKYLDGKL